jgi:bis(5'-nucleosidyl)-tetraphosphatase
LDFKTFCEGETEDIQTALRELREETGIQEDDIEVKEGFKFTETYYPIYKRFGNKKVEKTLVVFLAFLKKDKKITATEHKGYNWIAWNPPHQIQKNTIDSLLAAVQTFLQKDH